MSRTALVTGANRGIGAAIAAGLAGAGLRVIAAVRDPDSVDAGGNITPLRLDVGDPASIATAVERLAGDGIDVGVLVNNAGILDEAGLLTLDDAVIARTIEVNALGPLRLIRALAPGMAARGHGRIVNLSSDWGSLRGLGPGAYGVSKALLNAITVKLADELPASVKINAMCPGWVNSDMGGAEAPLTPEQGADTAIWLATLPDDGPSGGMFRDRQPLDWNA